jgi:hypothetical protein
VQSVRRYEQMEMWNASWQAHSGAQQSYFSLCKRIVADAVVFNLLPSLPMLSNAGSRCSESSGRAKRGAAGNTVGAVFKKQST